MGGGGGGGESYKKLFLFSGTGAETSPRSVEMPIVSNYSVLSVPRKESVNIRLRCLILIIH